MKPINLELSEHFAFGILTVPQAEHRKTKGARSHIVTGQGIVW
jgi:hypothetical protein